MVILIKNLNMKSNKNLFYLLIIYYVSTILLQSCCNMQPNDIAKTNYNILENAFKILNDGEFAQKMKNAPNPYGIGDSAKLTVDAIEDYYAEGLLDISAPEDIMTSFARKMVKVTDDITVNDFEDRQNALIHMVFDGKKMRFPYDDLNIKDMCVTYDERE